MDLKEIFIRWKENKISYEEMINLLKCLNSTQLQSFLLFEKVHLIKSPLRRIINGASTRDELINWLEDLDDYIILKVAQRLNDCFTLPIWDQLEKESADTILYDIENSNSITLEILNKAITNSIVENITQNRPGEYQSKPAICECKIDSFF